MFQRSLPLLTLAVVLGAPASHALAFPGLARAAYAARSESGRTWRTVTYPVADLVVPVPSQKEGSLRPLPEILPNKPATEAAPPSAPPKLVDEKLLQLITQTVQPETWSDAGGKGTLCFERRGMNLVVSNTAGAHEEIQHLFAALRRLQAVQVAVEVRIVQVEPEFLEHALKGLSVAPIADKELATSSGKEESFAVVVPSGPTWRAPLDPKQAEHFLKAIQGHSATNIMQAPRITMFPGQICHVEAVDTQTLLTAVHVDVMGGRVRVAPTTTRVASGSRFGLKTAVSADRRTVQVHLEASLASATWPAGALTAEHAEGDEAVAAALVRKLSHPPTYTKVHVKPAMKLPDGHTMIFQCGTVGIETRHEFTPPLVQRVPYLHRLCSRVGYGREDRSVLILVTPRVIVDEEVQTVGR